MAITVQCEQCGKSFAIPDHLAGRRGRCDQCGHVFWLTAPSSSSSSAGGRSSSPATAENSASTATRPAVQSILIPPRMVIVSPSPPRQRKSGEPFRFPKADVLDTWLAPLLILIGFGVPIVYVIREYSHLRLVSLLLFIFLVIPAAFCGVAIAARRIKFGLPEQAGLRMAAVLAVPLGLTYAVVLPLGAGSYYVLAGWLIGNFPAFFAFWFLYRLTGRQAIIGFIWAMVLAMLVGAAAGWGLDVVMRSAFHQ